MPYTDITQHEAQAFRAKYDLATAHTHQKQSPSQQAIIDSLPRLWHEAESLKQYELDERFIDAFFRSQRQLTALDTPTMLFYASSIAMVCVANYLALNNLRVSLIEPTFDNIHDILVNLGVGLDTPLREQWLHDANKLYDTLVHNVRADALLIVEPNNPTGFTLEGDGQTVDERKARYRELIRYAKDHDKLLIFDFSFSAFLLEDAQDASFDIYKELNESGIAYITIEDTGKIWPTQDAKVALLKTSTSIYNGVHDIQTSYLLNVSPFILNLVTQYALDSERDSFASVLSLFTHNRETVRRLLKDSILELQEPVANVSVAWLKINADVPATELQALLERGGIHVLPGTYFFWSNHEKGQQFIRVALARDVDYFEAAIHAVRTVIDKL